MMYLTHILKKTRGFTLIETLVAISLLTVAIVAPMSLAAQSLAAAYYARDQITAFFLAQEAIEAVRSVRDAQILEIAQNTGTEGVDLFGSVPLGDTPFTIDAGEVEADQAIDTCDTTCPPLQTNGDLYGYYDNPPTNPPPSDSGWQNSNFTRTVRAAYVDAEQDEVRLTVTVTWKTGAFQERSFSISENLYRWVNDGSGSVE